MRRSVQDGGCDLRVWAAPPCWLLSKAGEVVVSAYPSRNFCTCLPDAMRVPNCTLPVLLRPFTQAAGADHRGHFDQVGRFVRVWRDHLGDLCGTVRCSKLAGAAYCGSGAATAAGQLRCMSGLQQTARCCHICQHIQMILAPAACRRAWEGLKPTEVLRRVASNVRLQFPPQTPHRLKVRHRGIEWSCLGLHSAAGYD